MDRAGDLSRFFASPDGILVHTNETLVCRDCLYRYDIVGSCEKYRNRKPEGVLEDTEPCPFYRKGKQETTP